jgi:tRNA splicing ligase
MSLLLLPFYSYQIRKLFNLGKDDDVRKYVNTYRRTFEANGKKHSKAPRIQRLVTPETLQRKRRKAAIKKAKHEKSRTEAAEYHKLLVQVRVLAFSLVQVVVFAVLRVCKGWAVIEATEYHKLLVQVRMG